MSDPFRDRDWVQSFRRGLGAFVEEVSSRELEPKPETRLRGFQKTAYRDLPADTQASVLEETGWALLFGETERGRAESGLGELIHHRSRQASKKRFRSDLVVPRTPDGECVSGQSYLWSHIGEAPGVVDVDKLPYYVLIVASPKEVPFEFQYELAVNRAVGRLYFEDPADYQRYARAVVAAETAVASAKGSESRSMGFFYVDDRPNESDKAKAATRILGSHMVSPARAALDRQHSSNRLRGLALWRGEQATTDGFQSLLRGGLGGHPALVVACHGKGKSCGHPEQRTRQGGLVCRDGTVFAENVELPEPEESPILGKVFFLLSCFGAGMPRHEEFLDPNYAFRGGIHHETELAPEPFVAALPQKLLAGGALGVFGHVNRGFTSSYRWLHKGDGTEAARSFTDLLTRFLNGDRLGHAMRPMSRRSTNIAGHFLSCFHAWMFDRELDPREVYQQWIAWVDARNFILLGDPAAQALSPKSPTQDKPTPQSTRRDGGRRPRYRDGSPAEGPDIRWR